VRDLIKRDFRVDGWIDEAIRRHAMDGSMSYSEAVRAMLGDYLRIRKECALENAPIGETDTLEPGTLHLLLEEMERKFFTTGKGYELLLLTLRRELIDLQALFEQFALMFLEHTPKVPTDIKKAYDADAKARFKLLVERAKAAANRRHSEAI
jgi:hypothetical protein